MLADPSAACPLQAMPKEHSCAVAAYLRHLESLFLQLVVYWGVVTREMGPQAALSSSAVQCFTPWPNVRAEHAVAQTDT